MKSFKYLPANIYAQFRAVVLHHIPTYPLPYATSRDRTIKVNGEMFNAAIAYLAAVCTDDPEVMRLVTEVRSQKPVNVALPANIPSHIKKAIIDRATEILNHQNAEDPEEQRKIIEMVAAEYGLIKPKKSTEN
jgi:hypothetical protein